jgi:Fe-S cluster assembly iron-binding protein IscA
VLAVTEAAASAVNTILAGSELPEEGGMRIARAPAAENSEAPGLTLSLHLVPAPEDGDQVVGGEHVFVDPEAAEALDDKVLHAEVVENQVQFVIGEQSET